MSDKVFYITTPLYYANDELHIGHAFTTLAADIISRYKRSTGVKVHFLTGSDEHGQKVQESAKKNNRTPQEHTDMLVGKFKALWEMLAITYDDFIRTTEKRHTDTVKYVLQKLYDSGDIYEDEYEGKYCTPCERFWTEKETEDNLCPDCQRPVHPIKEKNYFFRMSKYQQKLIVHINSHPDFIMPENRKNEVLGFLKKPLNDLCISRPKSRLSWGIDLPFDNDYVTYVWFDALTNYISAVGYPNDMANFEEKWPASLHLIGKDILTTHAVYWGTMLLALDLPLPKTIFAHGWWLTDKSKMSKSLGNVLNPLDLVKEYGLNPFRYYLFSEMVFGQDASYTHEKFVFRYNADLANDYGNLCQRTLPMLIKNRDRTFKKVPAVMEATKEVEQMAATLKEQYIVCMDNYALNAALEEVWKFIQRLNKYVDETAPWKVAKENDNAKLDEIFYTVGESIRFASVLVEPFMPHISHKMIAQLGCKEKYDIKTLTWGELKSDTKCEDPVPLFPRLETERIANLKKSTEQKSSLKESKPKTDENFISFDDFGKIELCVAEVITAEKIENADKLLKLTVKTSDDDSENSVRELVSGIALDYSPEELKGKQVVLLKNLKPAKIRGVKSAGMLLATAGKDGKMTLLGFDRPAKTGAKIS